MKPGSDRDRQRAAQAELERLRRDTDALAGLFGRGATYFRAPDAGNDSIELWGTRIGRALAAVAFLGFCIYLYLSYVR